MKTKTNALRAVALTLLAAAAMAIPMLLLPSTALAGQDGSSVNVYRLYNPYTGAHFHTASQSEYDGLVAAGWKGEGVAWKAPKSSRTGVFRLYNPSSGDHYLTSSQTEAKSFGDSGWKTEGIAFWSDDAQEKAVYRLYNRYSGQHLLTASKAEYDSLGASGWKQEGIAMYGLRDPADGPVVDLSAVSVAYVGEAVDLKATVTPAQSGVKYNFVWMRDDWAEWDSDMRGGGSAIASDSSTFVPTHTGTYYVWVDAFFGGKKVTSGLHTIEVPAARRHVTFDYNCPSGTAYAGREAHTYGPSDAIQTPSPVVMQVTGKGLMRLDSWNTRADGTGTPYAAGADVSASVEAGHGLTLYAQWAALPSTLAVALDANGGTGCPAKATISASASTATRENKSTGPFVAPTVSVTPPAGKVLDGWYDDAGNSWGTLDEDQGTTNPQSIYLTSDQLIDAAAGRVTLHARWRDASRASASASLVNGDFTYLRSSNPVWPGALVTRKSAADSYGGYIDTRTGSWLDLGRWVYSKNVSTRLSNGAAATIHFDDSYGYHSISSADVSAKVVGYGSDGKFLMRLVDSSGNAVGDTFRATGTDSTLSAPAVGTTVRARLRVNPDGTGSTTASLDGASVTKDARLRVAWGSSATVSGGTVTWPNGDTASISAKGVITGKATVRDDVAAPANRTASGTTSPYVMVRLPGMDHDVPAYLKDQYLGKSTREVPPAAGTYDFVATPRADGRYDVTIQTSGSHTRQWWAASGTITVSDLRAWASSMSGYAYAAQYCWDRAYQTLDSPLSEYRNAPVYCAVKLKHAFWPSSVGNTTDITKLATAGNETSRKIAYIVANGFVGTDSLVVDGVRLNNQAEGYIATQLAIWLAAAPDKENYDSAVHSYSGYPASGNGSCVRRLCDKLVSEANSYASSSSHLYDYAATTFTPNSQYSWAQPIVTLSYYRDGTSDCLSPALQLVSQPTSKVTPLRFDVSGLFSMWQPISGYDQSRMGWTSSQTDGTMAAHGGDPIARAGVVEYYPNSHRGYAMIAAYSDGSVYQDVATTPGAVYHWTVWHSHRSGASSARMSVLLGHSPAAATGRAARAGLSAQSARRTATWSGGASKASAVGYVSKAIQSAAGGSDTDRWDRYEGIYVCPPGQTSTRMSFVDASGGKSLYNALSDYNAITHVTFERWYPLVYDLNGGTGTVPVPSVDPERVEYSDYFAPGTKAALVTGARDSDGWDASMVGATRSDGRELAFVGWTTSRTSAGAGPSGYDSIRGKLVDSLGIRASEDGNVAYAAWMLKPIVHFDANWPFRTSTPEVPADQVIEGAYDYAGAHDAFATDPGTSDATWQRGAVRTIDGRRYQFLGWYTDPGCTRAFDFSTPVTSDVTLYAKWAVGTTIRFHFHSSSMINEGTDQGILTGTTASGTKVTGYGLVSLPADLDVMVSDTSQGVRLPAMAHDVTTADGRVLPGGTEVEGSVYQPYGWLVGDGTASEPVGAPTGLGLAGCGSWPTLATPQSVRVSDITGGSGGLAEVAEDYDLYVMYIGTASEGASGRNG